MNEQFIDLGKNMLTHGGEWNESTKYDALVMVTHKHDLWYSTEGSTGVEPKAGVAKWQRITDVATLMTGAENAESAYNAIVAQWNTLSPQITSAISNADTKATLANTKATYANEQGDYAKSQGNYAKTEGAKIAPAITAQTARVDTAVSSANTAASRADGAKDNANDAAQNANAREVGGTLTDGTTISAANSRVGKENARIAAETARQTAESARAVAETQRASTFTTNEGTESQEASASGSRWQRFKAAEAERKAIADADHNTATSDHNTATSDHAQAAADHETSVGVQNAELVSEVGALMADDRDFRSLPALCGQPMILFGEGTPQEAVIPTNWVGLADGGYAWNGTPSAIGQQYINTSVNAGGRYIAVRDNNFGLKWLNF